MEKDNSITIIEEQKASESSPFYSYRKVIKCLSDGVSLYTDNLWQVGRLLAPVVAVLALMSVVCGLPVLSQLVSVPYVWIPVFLLYVAVACFFTSVCYAYVMKRKVAGKDSVTIAEMYNLAWRKYPRALFAGGLMLVLNAAYGVCAWLLAGSMPESLVWKVVVTCCSFLLFLVFVALSVPMQTASSAVLLERGKLFKTYFTGYKYGMKSWLRLFSLTVMLVIIMCFVSLMLLAPWYVMQMIEMSSAQSVMNGDSVSLSGGFVIAEYVVTFVCAVLCLHLCCVVNFVYAYFYASAKADIREREENEIPLI